MNNLLSYCGLIKEKTSTSEKDLPVLLVKNQYNALQNAP
jgi:hypothetical protein